MAHLNLASDAVKAALEQNWNNAIKLNLEILKQEKENIDALSRLAFAYLKSGDFKSAKKTYEKVLKIDKYNHIAQKNLQKLSTIRKKDIGTAKDSHLSPLMFLEEPGKTKIVDCINLAPNQVLTALHAGEQLELRLKNHSIEVRNSNATYLGALPDDVSFRLSKLMAAGNTYQTIVKTVDKNALKILIRELSRGKKFAHQPSFTSTTSYIPFSKGGTTVSPSESPDMTPTGEEPESTIKHEDAGPEA